MNSDFLIRGVEVEVLSSRTLTTATPALLFTPTFVTYLMFLLCAWYKDGRIFYASACCYKGGLTEKNVTIIESFNSSFLLVFSFICI